MKNTIYRKGIGLLIFLFAANFFAASQSLTGLWTGSLSNDSTTVRKDQSFEIALTEYKGKVYGYSRSEFIVNDTLFYIVKRVKGTIEGDLCEVTDDEIIAYNFRGKLDKGIKVTSTFRRSQGDSIWHLDGNWKTNATKKYYSVTGKVGLAEEKDLTASKIFPHLEELNLANEIAFYKERVESIPVVRVVKPERKSQTYTEPNGLIATTTTGIAAAEPALVRAETDYVKPLSTPEKNTQAFKEPGGLSATTTSGIAAAAPSLVRAETDYVKPINTPEKNTQAFKEPTGLSATTTTGIVAGEPVLVRAETDYVKPVSVPEKIPVTTAQINPTLADKQRNAEVRPALVKQAVTTKPPTTDTHIDITAKSATSRTDKPIVQQTGKTITSQAPQTKAVATAQPGEKQNSMNTPSKQVEAAGSPERTNAGIAGAAADKPVVKPAVDVTLNAATISGRKSEFSQAVNFKSDSLVIALYDNGEIDGDTVSVYMNGQVIMSRQGLKGSAVKKTIYITPGNEDFSLVLFADNLGKYPPNTGLLVVYDGDDVYNLRFSSDFQKNAGIVFRRKR